MNCKYTYRYLFALLIVFGPLFSWSQLTVDGTKTPVQLVEDVLLGAGVTATNITYTGSNIMRGEFNSTNSNIGFNAGVLLTSGSINGAIGPNTSGSTSTNNGRAGDADLNAIITGTTRDAAVLEFDFRPLSDTIRFNYVFASEEYPEYAPPLTSTFNDAFAFFLTGPNPTGGSYTNVNIALIPGTSTPVSINNVNRVTNTAYYISNGNNANGSQSNPFNPANINNVQFDAFTTPLTAIAHVVPCQTYHIKLVVADVFDFVWDSGVFLEANSFGSTVPNPQIDFVSSAPACTGDTVNFLNTGTSGPGILYKWYFGSGASIDSSSLENPTNIVYSTPGLKLVEYNMNVNCGDTTMKRFKGINIEALPAPDFSSNAPQCAKQPVNFAYAGTTGSNWTYNWDFGSGASPSTSFAQNPSAIVYSTSGLKTVTLTVSNGMCTETITKNITINARPTASFTSNSPAGIGNAVNFTNTGTTGAAYSWLFGSGSNPASSVLENPSGITYSSEGSKTVRLITTASGCKDTAVNYINILTTPVPSFTSNAPQPVGFPILFTYTGNNGGGFTYNWDFGSGALPSTSNAQNPPAVFYSTTGTKTITLTVTNGLITVIYTQTIVIDVPPVSNFTSTAPNCEGIGIDFQSMANAGSTFEWNFGVGASPATSTTANPTGIVYSSSGFKTVQLITTLNGDKDTSENVIYIVKQPQVSFTHNGPQCQGEAVNFAYSGNSGNNWTYTWDLGFGANPSISTASSPTGIHYQNHGNKVVSLTVSNSFCSDSSSQLIVINQRPISGFTTTAPACSDDSIAFTNTGNSGMTYNWDFGLGSSPSTSTDEHPINVYYNGSGLKTVRQVISLGACHDTSYNTINVLETPKPSFTNNADACMGEYVLYTYTGNIGSGWTASWDYGSGSNPHVFSGFGNRFVKYSSAGTKNSTLTVSNQFCAATTSGSVVIDSTPVASIVTSAPVCTGDSLQLGAAGLNPSVGPYSYSWTFTGNPTFNLSSLKAVYANSGIETVKLVLGLGNCFDSTEASVIVNQSPDVSFSSTAPVCQGDAVNFLNTTATNGNWNYIWDFGSQASPNVSAGENPGNVRFKSDGNHQVILKVSDKNCFNSDTNIVLINALPAANAGIDTIICADTCVEIGSQSQNAFTYSWFPSNGLNDPKSANPIACPSAEFTQYILTMKNDSTSCISSDTIVLTMLTSAMADAGVDVELCLGDSIQIGSSGLEGQTYLWTPQIGLSDATESSPSVSPVESGKHTYSVSVSYKDCPSIEDQVEVLVRKATARVNDDLTIAKGEKVELNASGGVLYLWDHQETGIGTLSHYSIPNPMAEPWITTTYFVYVTDVFNCKDTASVTVNVVDPKIFLPTAFTPNGSGRNDIFRVRGNPLTQFEMSVFNRSGELIYYSKDFYAGWDGTDQQSGKALSQGAYVYKVKGFDELGEEVILSGMVNLIR